jgi:glycosyltransferase involved in cell wall biosynthesis
MQAALESPLTTASAAPAGTLTVCQLLHTLNVGGAEMLAARLARGQRDQCRFVFACLDELGTLGEELKAEGSPVEVIGRKAGLDWCCVWRLARFLRREQVDVIHAHQYTPFFYGIMARLLYRRPPILFTEHGRHFPDFPRRKRILANRLLLERRDRVIGVGEAVRQALITNEGIPADRVGVIYNGIDTERFADRPAERDEVRREIGLQPGDFAVLMVARLDYLKDHATAIRMLARVARQAPYAKLILAGDGPERPKIEELIAELGIARQVRMLGLRKDVARLVQAADLFLLTSISEGIPLTVIEAMAAKLPVVATQVGGMAEVVEHGVSGLLAPSGDDGRLAACVLRLVHDAELRKEMGARGQQRARTLFSESDMQGRYVECYGAMAGV